MATQKTFTGVAAHELAAAASDKPDPGYDAARQAALVLISSEALGGGPDTHAFDVELTVTAGQATVMVKRAKKYPARRTEDA